MKTCTGLQLLVLIVPHPKGKPVLRYAKRIGAKGVTAMLGQGTVNNRFLDLLGLAVHTKDILWILADQSNCGMLSDIALRFAFAKPYRGIGFSVPVDDLFGASNSLGIAIKDTQEDAMYQHEAIIAIVPKGRGENIVDAAREVGATGATIINARGAGIHETARLFSVDIEPEKEIVLIIVDAAQKETVCKAIIERTQIDQPGQGVLFTQPIREVYGLSPVK